MSEHLSDRETLLLIGTDDASMCRLLLLVSDKAGVAPPVKLVTNEIILLPATSDNILLSYFLELSVMIERNTFHTRLGIEMDIDGVSVVVVVEHLPRLLLLRVIILHNKCHVCTLGYCSSLKSQ